MDKDEIISQAKQERKRLMAKIDAIDALIQIYEKTDVPADSVSVKPNSAKPNRQAPKPPAKPEISFVEKGKAALRTIGHEAKLGDIRVAIQKQFGGAISPYLGQMLSRDVNDPKGDLYRTPDGKLGLKTWRSKKPVAKKKVA